MKLAAKILIVISLLNMAVFTGCETDDSDPKYSFKVISSNGSFTGYYILNGDDYVSFSSTADPDSAVFHRYEKSISSIDSIIIYTTAVTDATTGLSIYLYSDKTLLEKTDVSRTEIGEVVNLTLEYSASSEEE